MKNIINVTKIRHSNIRIENGKLLLFFDKDVFKNHLSAEEDNTLIFEEGIDSFDIEVGVDCNGDTPSFTGYLNESLCFMGVIPLQVKPTETGIKVTLKFTKTIYISCDMYFLELVPQPVNEFKMVKLPNKVKAF